MRTDHGTGQYMDVFDKVGEIQDMATPYVLYPHDLACWNEIDNKYLLLSLHCETRLVRVQFKSNSQTEHRRGAVLDAI